MYTVTPLRSQSWAYVSLTAFGNITCKINCPFSNYMINLQFCTTEPQAIPFGFGLGSSTGAGLRHCIMALPKGLIFILVLKKILNRSYICHYIYRILIFLSYHTVRVLINSRFGVSYSNFSFLTPTFWKVSIEKYGKTQLFLDDSILLQFSKS